MSREASSSSSSSSIRFFDLSKSTQVEADENGFRTSESSGHFPPSRAPLNAIPDPSQYPKEARKPGSDFGNKIEGSRAIRSSSGRVEASDSLPPGRGTGSVNCSYGCTRVSGRGKPHPEPSSAQTTPAKSASRASNIGSAGAWTVPRPLQYAGAGEGSCSRVSRGISSAISEPEVHHFELVEDPSFWIDRNVQVLIRIRPLSTLERTLQGCNRCLRQESAQSLAWLGHPETRFTFDNIACETISQEKLFRVAGLPTVDNCMSGYNSCIFAYGQTGSGKTYTMMGDMQYMERKVNDDCGMTPRIFDYLFMRIKAEEEKRRAEKLKFTCKCSFLEIYNEQIMDLLEPSSVNLQLREDLKKGVYVENLTEYSVTSVNDVVKLLSKGAAHRKMAATQMNGESSRSHSVFTSIIESQWENDFRSHFRFGRLNLVDLAGSERQKCSGAEGGRLKEAANINKSLSTLSLVIMSLVDLANGKHRHVPYRDSRLTFLLQDSLGGNSKTTIIANISPSICYANETLSTLKFAQRAKLIQNNAKVNEDASDDVLALQTQIVQLKDQLSFMMKHHNVSSLSNFLQCFEEYRSSIPLEELGNSAEETLADDVGKVVSTWTGGGWIDHQADDAVQKHIKNDQEMHNLLVMQLADTQKELMDARFLIEAMESDHVCLHNELLFLQEENNRYKEIFSNKNLVTNNCWDLSREYLRTKVDKMSEELEQARLLNSQYQEDRAIQLSRQQQVDIVSEQAELETVKTILHLQDEIVALKLEFKENLHCMDEENTRLRKTIVAKEDELRASCIEWERAILELTTFLLNGSISLKEASGQIQSIAGLFPQANVLIGEHVERAAKLCIEKDETILLLQKSLAESQKLLLEVEFKLSLLKGATIALTGLRQLEHDGNTIEARHLATSWSDKIENAKQLVSELMTINDVKDSGDLSTAADDYASDSLVSENVNQKNIPQMKLYQLMQETVQVLPSLEARMRGTEAGCHDVIELHSDGVNLADNLLTKFEEARTTMEEADLMLNALLKASEKAEWLSGMWKQEGEKLMAEKAALVEEVEQLKSTLHIMDKENTEMQSQFHDIMEEMTKFMSFVKESFQQIGKDVEEWFRAVHSDSLSLKKDVLYGICNSRSSLEDICSNIMEKGFASFVLYQCHAAKLLSKSHSHLMASKLFAVQPQECHSINNLLGNLLCSGSSTSFNGVESIRELDLGATVTKKDKEEDILMYENQYLKKELERKDVLLKGVLFDFSLLQESASNTKDIKNESEKLMKALSQAHQELEGKTSQLHEVLLQCGKLEAHVTDTEASLSKSILDLQQAEETIDSLLNQNAELRMLLKDMFHTKLKAEEQLDEHKEIVKELEKEILSLNSSVEKSLLSTFENTKEDLIRVTSEKNRLLEEVGTLNDKLEMASAIADENEAIAVEARQESEACKLYAEQKEDEVKILEHSVEELEFTINVLEKKVSEMSKEVKKHQVDRDLIELDAEALRRRLVSVENFTDDTVSGNSSEHHQLFRKLHSKGLELDEAHNRIMILEDEREKHAKEMKECKDYISELVLHAEAQASQYQRKYKTLEAMFREVKADLSTTYTAPSSSDKIEKSSSRTRGSSSPFRCITSMVQQMNLEKDHELSMARLRVEELESIVASRQKEVCMLNTRLAAAESMTHDVIRDLLGIKSDVTNYANLIGELEIQKVLEAAQFQTKESLKKEQEIHNLMSQIKDLIEEKKSCFVESSKRDACALAAQLKLQQLEERNQLLTAQNELLKKEKTNLLAKVAELDDMMKKIFEMEKTQQRIESSARIEKFWNVEDANLTKRLANSEKLLFHVNDELPRYISSGILHEKLERQVSDIKRAGNGKP